MIQVPKFPIFLAVILCFCGCGKLDPSAKPSFTITGDYKLPVEAHLKRIRDDHPEFELRFSIVETGEIFQTTIVASGSSAPEAEMHAQRATRFLNEALLDELIAEFKQDKGAKLKQLYADRAKAEVLLKKNQDAVNKARARVKELQEEVETLKGEPEPEK